MTAFARRACVCDRDSQSVRDLLKLLDLVFTARKMHGDKSRYKDAS